MQSSFFGARRPYRGSHWRKALFTKACEIWKVEAASGFEPLNGGFADLSLNHLGTPPRSVGYAKSKKLACAPRGINCGFEYARARSAAPTHATSANQAHFAGAAS